MLFSRRSAVQIHKIIFRFDFEEANLDVIDGPGRVVKTVKEGATKEWEDFKLNPATHVVVASFDDHSLIRRIMVEPKTIVGHLERVKPISVERLDQDSDFQRLLEAADRVRRAFEVKAFARFGLRIWTFGRI